MISKKESALDRPNPSRALRESRKLSRDSLACISPGRRMEAAFTLSMDARKLRIAALRAQGFSETDIDEIMNAAKRQ